MTTAAISDCVQVALLGFGIQALVTRKGPIENLEGISHRSQEDTHLCSDSRKDGEHSMDRSALPHGANTVSCACHTYLVSVGAQEQTGCVVSEDLAQQGTLAQAVEHGLSVREVNLELRYAWTGADHLRNPWSNNFITSIATIQDTVGGFQAAVPDAASIAGTS